MPFNLEAFGNNIASLVVVYGINVVGAIVIAFIGRWVAGLVERMMKRGLLEAAHTDATVSVFLSSLSYYSVLVLTFLLILQVIGIQATSLVAVAGAASLAIGLALQGTLTNLAAGVMLLLFRPFRLGDSIEVAGKSGVVKGLNIFMTEIAAGDNVQVLIPNGQVWGTAITNQSTYPLRHVGLTMSIAPADVDAVVASFKTYVDSNTRILRQPAPSVSLSNVTEKGIEISVQGWATVQDAGAIKADMIAHLITTMRKPEQSQG
jgi:small conductance mechanosensitive channel